MANKKYNSFKANLLKGVFDFESDTIKCMLVSTSYVGTANIDTDTITQANAGEISGTAYVTGGASLASKTVTQDNTNDKGVFDAANVTWGSSTITAGGAVLYKDTTNELICLIDFGGDKVSSNGDFTINWDADGIFDIA